MHRKSSFLVLIFALLLVAILVLLVSRVWQAGAMGCMRVFQNAEYSDPDELDRMGWIEPEPTEPVFSDSAYDEVFPDLYEPANGDSGE